MSATDGYGHNNKWVRLGIGRTNTSAGFFSVGGSHDYTRHFAHPQNVNFW
jgi:hypothetical protein